MKIIKKTMSALKASPYNPRKDLKPGDREYEQLKKAILEFDYIDPIVWNERTGNVVGGHQRLKVLKELDYKTIHVSVVDLPDHKEKALNIALNKISGEWDLGKLSELLEELKMEDIDIDLMGFTREDLDALFIDKEKGLTDADAVPEVPEDPITKPGDLWLLGEHRVLCGDATKREDVERLMGGEKADMVFTDPPYNIDYGNIKHPKFKQRNIKNDNISSEEFKIFCESFIGNIKSICSGCVYVFGPPGPDGRIMFSCLDNSLHCSTTIIWNKDVFILGRGKYQNKYEPCWFGWNDSGAAFIDDRKLTNVWDFPRPKSSKLHPTMKPVVIIENAIGHASNVGGVVFDLFLGSGSTLIACEKTGRRCYGLEIDPHYCDVIVKRWEDFTGEKAKPA